MSGRSAAGPGVSTRGVQLTVHPAVPAPAPVSRARPRQLDLLVSVQKSIARAASLSAYHVMRLGAAAVLGIAAILAAAVLAVTSMVAGKTQTDALLTRIAQARSHPPAASSSAGDSLARIIGAMPTREEMPAVLSKVLSQARAAGVALDSGHYAYVPAKTGEIGRYELEFPLKADYPGVRAFIDHTLLAIPAAGLDKLHVERKAVGETTVNADVRFVIFVRSG